MFDRRQFLQGAGVALAAPKRSYRAAVIGHTGRGNYGHNWERCWTGLAGVQVVALADPDDAGRKAAAARSGAAREYRDYRQMLAAEKPDLVAITPRWCDQRVEMVTAAAQIGAHLVVEKPFARSVEEADLLLAAADRRKVQVQVGHPARIDPVTLQAARLLRDGAIGELMEIRARGKEDARAGGEDLIVLGTHCFDLMRFFAGDPEWVFAHVTERGREVRRGMERKANEDVGPVAGDDITAIFRFARGVDGHFGSRRSGDRSGTRFGVTLCGSKGQIFLPLSSVPGAPAEILRSPSWAYDKAGGWERLPLPEGRFQTREAVNQAMAADLIEAIEKGRPPVCSARDGLWTIEMVSGVYQSQMSSGRISFPLRDRRPPLASKM